MYLKEKKIGTDCPVYIIGEIGINHNGDINIAKKLIDSAVNAGCDAVKFQKEILIFAFLIIKKHNARNSMGLHILPRL